MPEDQLIALPPEVRTMVMTGANAMMNNAAANSGMMGSGVMMDMSMMGPMGMGMNGDINMGGPLMQGMMPDNTQVQQSGIGIVPANSTPEQVGNGIGMMQDGFNPGAGSGNMMNIGMGGDFVIQVTPKSILSEKTYSTPAIRNKISHSRCILLWRLSPLPLYQAVVVLLLHHSELAHNHEHVGFQAEGVAGEAMEVMVRRSFSEVFKRPSHGSIVAFTAPPSAPVRPASPLPPGVPTGPRNQNKYKDRDGNAPAVDGLDYGGGKEGMGRRTPSGEPEERISSR
jgi:pre-mRNA 3'-end-processing factor FIP1